MGNQGFRSGTKRVMIILLISILTFSLVDAQTRSISGTIKAKDSGETLPNATVLIKGSLRGTVTDVDGRYSIEIQEGDDALVFSYVGYQPLELPVTEDDIVDAFLVVESTSLDEVVVIGYGRVKKSDLTGSVSSVKTEDLIKVTSVNPEQGLQGKVAGVQVTSTSGAPGAAPVVRIRGVGTFNNASPIFVVDGVILDNISFLNSADIASMEVLKDASATAIYGSRGANGVIIITTKTGSPGQGKARFDLSGEIGIRQLTKTIDLLNGREFAIISNEIKPGSYNNVDAVPNTDWQDVVFKTGKVQNYQLSITGATDMTQYYVGLGMFTEEGIIDKSSYQRITLKLNNTYKLTENIKLGNNITIAPYKLRNAPNVTYAVYRAQPLLEPYYADGTFAVVYNVGNPLADLEYSNSYGNGIRSVGNIFAEASFLDAFTIRSSFGIDGSYNKVENYTPAFTVYNPDGTASQQQNVLSDIFKGNSENLSWLWENTVTYDKVFTRHSINVLAGYTMQETKSEVLGLSGENVIRNSGDFWYLNPSYVYDPANNVNTIQSIYNGVDPGQYYSMISYLFRTNYTFEDRYILTVTFRRDGSSKFNAENRFSNFPSFALGWNISNEKFMEDISFINNLKIRASWGIIGNEKIAYYDRYSRVQSSLLAVLGSIDTPNAAATYGKSGNPDLRWESTTQTDLGVETRVFNNRLIAELDFYNRLTEDILIELSTPGYMGNGQGQKVRYNAASVLNRGLEFRVNWREKRGDFSYDITFLGSTLHNEVKSIGGNSGVDSVLIGGYLGNGIPVTQSRVGLPIGAFYGYKTDGIFQTQEELDAYPHSSEADLGDLRFVDINKDGKITGLDRTYIGSPIPDFIFGLNLAVSYKNFDLSVDLQGQTGNEIFNGKEVVRPDPYNFEKHVFDRWTGPGTSTTEPRPSFGGYNFTPSDRFIYDGSFIRLRTLSLGYTVPAALSRKLYMEKLRVYIKATNLFTLTEFTGYTPEIGSYDVLSNGIDFGGYPVSATFSFGINLTF